MPSSIPYDPSLVLANIVDQARLRTVVDIAAAQAPADAAQEKLNALLSNKRSLDMTKQELMTLGIPVDALTAKLGTLAGKIGEAAADYADKKMTAEDKIQGMRASVSQVHEAYESPVDYLKTEIKTMPLASDSISMDVQYFSRDINSQDSSSFASTIGGFVSASTNWMGIKVSAQMTASAQKQVSEQMQRHDITGTLVISVSCTHKNASVLAPLVINPDKGIKAWNHIFPNDPLNPQDRARMMELAMEAASTTKNEAKYSIISGMTYGSSFVGMVHVLNSTTTIASQRLSSLAAKMQVTMSSATFLEGAAGGFGADTSMTNELKSLLSTQNITSHVSMICMGVIPSIVSTETALAVKTFSSFDPKTSMEAVATIQNANNAEQSSVEATANAARTGQGMIAMKSADVKSALSALSDIDDKNNKILDINSMMGALEDYLKKAAEGSSGVPLNYYLKDITKTALAELWIAKYFPQKVQIREDDSANAPVDGGDASAPPAS